MSRSSSPVRSVRRRPSAAITTIAASASRAGSDQLRDDVRRLSAALTSAPDGGALSAGRLLLRAARAAVASAAGLSFSPSTNAPRSELPAHPAGKPTIEDYRLALPHANGQRNHGSKRTNSNTLDFASALNRVPRMTWRCLPYLLQGLESDFVRSYWNTSAAVAFLRWPDRIWARVYGSGVLSVGGAGCWFAHTSRSWDLQAAPPLVTAATIAVMLAVRRTCRPSSPSAFPPPVPKTHSARRAPLLAPQERGSS